MKKTIAMICTAVFAQFAFAESEVVDGVTWYYSTYEEYVNGQYRYYAQITSGADKYSGNLTVPDTLGGYQVRKIGESAFCGCSGLTGITLPSGIVRIEYSAFNGCSGLLNVSLPGTLTYIGSCAFDGCSGLASVAIPDSVTSMGSQAFHNCSALQSVTLSRNLTSIPINSFYGCSSLQSIEFPAGVTSIGERAFYDCTALADAALPNGLTSIGNHAFYNCDSFTRFDIPATVESIGTRIIGECDNLKTITVDAGNINCKVVNNCLVSYSGSTLLAVPFGCATVNIPQGVTAIPEYMFYNDDNLVSVTIPQGVTSIGSYAFSYCDSLAAVEIPVGCTMVGDHAFYPCGSLTQVSLPDGLTSIGSYAFCYCNPAEIILPASVTTVGWSAFECGNYTSLRVVLLGAPPSGIANSYLLSSSNVSYSREHGAAWLEILNNINKFNGYNQTNKPEVEYVSVAVRESDPTILDVVYRVKSAKPTVKVRALAFKDGVRSFANVVRPETFIEGTEAHVGDAISANAEHKLTWRASSDWQIDLAKVKFEVLAVEEDLLPLELVTIPANGTNKAMEISWNAINADRVFDALLWLYADKDSGLILSDGVLRDANTGNVYVSRNHMAYRNDGDGSYFEDDYYNSSYWGNPTKYVFSKMGFSTLYGDELSYANKCTRMGLSPLGTRQYAYRWIEAE